MGLQLMLPAANHQAPTQQEHQHQAVTTSFAQLCPTQGTWIMARNGEKGVPPPNISSCSSAPAWLYSSSSCRGAGGRAVRWVSGQWRGAHPAVGSMAEGERNESPRGIAWQCHVAAPPPIPPVTIHQTPHTAAPACLLGGVVGVMGQQEDEEGQQELRHVSQQRGAATPRRRCAGRKCRHRSPGVVR